MPGYASGLVWVRARLGSGVLLGTETVRGTGQGWAQLPFGAHLMESIRPPGLEALVHTDPVCTQVRAWACPNTCLRSPPSTPPPTPDPAPPALPFSQLPARLQPPHHPWKPDQRHYLHPAQRPHQDWPGAGGRRGGGEAGPVGPVGNTMLMTPRGPVTLTPALSPRGDRLSVASDLLQR